MYKKILVGYDSSQGAKEAVVQAVKLAEYTGSEITALWVKGSLPHFPETIDEIESEKASAVSFYKKLLNEINEFSKRYDAEIIIDTKSGNPAKVIIDYAKKNDFDLIVIGHTGHSKIWGGFLGHIADKVSENAHCSVLIVRGSK